MSRKVDVIRDPTVTSFTLGPCKRCDHSPDWHRKDDGDGIDVTSPEAKFRCYGYDVEAPGPPVEPGVMCDCPDYVTNYQNVKRLRPYAD